MTSNASILKNIEEIVGKVAIESTKEEKTKIILEFLCIEMNEEIVKEAAWNFYTAAVDNRCLSGFYAELCATKVRQELTANGGISIMQCELLNHTLKMFSEIANPIDTEGMSEKNRISNIIFIGHLYNEKLVSHSQINNCLRFLEKRHNFGDNQTLLGILYTIINVRLNAVERDMEFPILSNTIEQTSGRVEDESEQSRVLLDTIRGLKIHSTIGDGDKQSKSNTKNTKGRMNEACVITSYSVGSKAIGDGSKERVGPNKIGRIADSRPINDFFLPGLAPFHIEEVTRVIERNYEMNKMSKSRREDLEVVRMKLEAVLKEKMPQKFRLDVFGSSENGFGSNKSDFDVCFRFEQEGKGDQNKRKLTLKTITRALVGTEFKNIVPINSAKVPIVKFTVKTPSGEEIQGDISYYNDFALHNTRLLAHYCKWTKDNLLAKLGLFIKRWVKHCGIADAANGSLSSYTHIILLIHILQQLQPPLLPVLHEMGTKKEIEVEGRDVYFYDDEPTPNWSSCNLSAGELFLRFLEYYVNFDWQNKVVQIRQLRQQKKTTNQKGWKNKMMYIEDPFVLEHNLGGKIKSEMFSFITKSFSTAREVFFSHKERELLTSSNERGMDNGAIGEERIDEYGGALLTRCHLLTGLPPQRKSNRPRNQPLPVQRPAVASGSVFHPPAPPRNTMNVAPPLTHYRYPSNFPAVPQN